MMKPEELEAEAVRLEKEGAAMISRAQTLRQLADRQRELDALVEQVQELPASRTRPRMTSHDPMKPTSPMPPAHRLAISLGAVKRMRGQPFMDALVGKSMTIQDYARLRGVPHSTVSSWMDPGPNGRRIPQDEAEFAQAFFGRTAVGGWVLPATDEIWPHGIRPNRRSVRSTA